MVIRPVTKTLQLPRNVIQRFITVVYEEVEHPAHDRPPRQPAGEYQTAHGAETNRRACPVLQSEVLDRRGATADASDDGADQTDRPFTLVPWWRHQHDDDGSEG